MTRNSIESPTATPYLPTEVVRQIFSNSTPRVIINARKSCRQLRDVIDGDRNLDSCIQIVKEMTSMTAAVYKVPTPVGAIPASRVDFQSCQLRFTSIYKIDARHIFLMQGNRYDNVRDRPLFNRDLQNMLKDDLMKYYNCNSFLTHVRACGILGPEKNKLLSIAETSFVFVYIFLCTGLGFSYHPAGAVLLPMTQVLAAGFAANVGVSVGVIAFATILSFREYRHKTDTIQQNINTLARRDFDEARENQRTALDRPVREMTPFEFNLLELRDYQVLAELGR